MTRQVGRWWMITALAFWLDAIVFHATQPQVLWTMTGFALVMNLTGITILAEVRRRRKAG